MSKEILIEGSVIRGRRIGRKIGFPTLNIPYGGDVRGVFVGEVLLNNEWRRAVIHSGKKPTVDDYAVNLEAHVLDWYKLVKSGTKVTFKLLKKIRNVKKFDNLEELRVALMKNVEFTRNWHRLT